MRKFKLWSTLAAIWLVRIPYGLACLLPVQRRKVTFASVRSAGPTGNLAAVYDKLEQDYPDLHLVQFFRRYHASLLNQFGFLWFMIRAAFHLATSRYTLVDDYFFPAYVIKPRKGTEIIQLWHAAGAFKKFGHSTVGKPYGMSDAYLKYVNAHGNYAKAIVSSTHVIPAFAEAFRMNPADVLPLGLPRTDVMFDAAAVKDARHRLTSLFPQTRGKKCILYAPTFRGKSHSQSSFTCPIDLAMLRDAVGDEYVFIAHLHPYLKDAKMVTNLPDADDFLIRIESELNIQELMMACDLLITDYSSVIFDFSLLQKPMAFFAVDLEAYLEERDFYTDYRTMIPGPLFDETSALAAWLAAGQFDVARLRAFRDTYFDDVDGQSTDRVVHYFWGLKSEPAMTERSQPV